MYLPTYFQLREYIQNVFRTSIFMGFFVTCTRFYFRSRGSFLSSTTFQYKVLLNNLVLMMPIIFLLQMWSKWSIFRANWSRVNDGSENVFGFVLRHLEDEMIEWYLNQLEHEHHKRSRLLRFRLIISSSIWPRTKPRPPLESSLPPLQFSYIIQVNVRFQTCQDKLFCLASDRKSYRIWWEQHC